MSVSSAIGAALFTVAFSFLAHGAHDESSSSLVESSTEEETHNPLATVFDEEFYRQPEGLKPLSYKYGSAAPALNDNDIVAVTYKNGVTVFNGRIESSSNDQHRVAFFNSKGEIVRRSVEPPQRISKFYYALQYKGRHNFIHKIKPGAKVRFKEESITTAESQGVVLGFFVDASSFPHGRLRQIDAVIKINGGPVTLKPWFNIKKI